MKKHKFDLQAPEFEQETSDNDQNYQPTENIMHQYQRQYSFIMQQTEKFLKECKLALERFIALNQFGTGFNLHFLLSNFMTMESNIYNSQSQQKNKNSKTILKEKYQISFRQLLQRMNQVIKDLINYQINFKQQYFGQAFGTSGNSQKSSPSKGGITQNDNSRSSQSRNNSLNSPSSLSSCNPIKKQNQEDKQKIQTDLRQILNQKLTPSKDIFDKVILLDLKPQENIDKLINKMDIMIQKIRQTKTKEEKLIKIFNDNKFDKKNQEPHKINLIHQKCFGKNKTIKDIQGKFQNKIKHKNESTTNSLNHHN